MAQQHERFLIWGGGGHGMVVADLVRASGGRVETFIDNDGSKLGSVVEPGGTRVELLEEEFLRDYAPDSSLPMGATAIALAVGQNASRAKLRSQVCPDHLPPVVAPNASISPSAYIRPGVVVMESVVVHAAAEIGAGAILNTGAVIEHECQLGEDTHVSPGAVVCGGVHIGDRAWIGARAVIIPQVRVGADCVIGAGAVVVRDVPDGQTVVGNPAKNIEQRSNDIRRA